MRRRHFLHLAPAFGLGGLLARFQGKHIVPYLITGKNGQADRNWWLDTLLYMSRPVLEALAEDRLREAMPVEAVKPELVKDRRRFTHLEAFGRLMDGLAPWLELDPALLDPPEARLQEQYRRLADQALKNAVDPEAKSYLDFKTPSQPLVDAAFLAQALIRSPRWWARAGAHTQEQVVQAFLQTRNIRPFSNNWLLFSAMIEAFFYRIGAEWDKMRVDYALRQHEQWYKGDGVYGDGPDFHWDYYNSFVIQPFMTDILNTLTVVETVYQKLREKHDRIAGRYAVIQERLINTDGTFPAIGRSIAYRCGAFHHLANTALLGKLPAELAPPQVRCGLTAVIKATLTPKNTFDEKGWLRLGLAGHQPALAETYISTGSLYLCSLAFLPLGLPPADPFWSGPAQDWTSRQVWSGNNVPADHALSNL